MKRDRVVGEILGSESVLAPSDIVNKDFRRSMFGYDAREVEAYLGRIADVLEMQSKEVRELKQALDDYKDKLEEYRQLEETLRNALVTSQKFGENLIESARREAEAIVEAARVEQQRIAMEAGRLPAALEQEIARLQEQRDRLRRELASILATHRDLLDALAPAEEQRPFLLGLRDHAYNNDAAEHPFPPVDNSK